MKRVKILVLGSTRLVRELVNGILAEAPEFEVVAAPSELCSPGLPCTLLALTDSGETGLLCDLAPDRLQVIELSPDTLLDALRRRERPA